MSIGIYTAADASALISQNDTFTNTLLVAVNGRLGGVSQQRLYARNTEHNKSYSSIQVSVENPADPSLINGVQFTYWKLIAGDQKPADWQWDAVATGNVVALPNIGTISVGDNSTYVPFWLYVRVPRNSNANTFITPNIVIRANEILVP